MVENPAEVAEHFNSHFCSVGAVLDSKIPRSNRSPLSYMGQRSITSFNAGPASDIEVETIIWGLIVYLDFLSPFRLLYSRNMQDRLALL